VVVADGVRPFAEPAPHGLHQLLTEERVTAKLLPLLVGRLARLVQDLGADLELADVVQQRRPVEPVEVVAGQPELPSEAVAVGAHPLGVTPRKAVVDVKCGDELQQQLRRLLRGPSAAGRPERGEALLEALDRAGAQRELEP
jgi:hypothetical protein